MLNYKSALENVVLWEVCYFSSSEEGHSCECASVSENCPMKFKVCVAQNTWSLCQGECGWGWDATGKAEFQSVLRCSLRALVSVLQKRISVQQFFIFSLCFPLLKLHFLLFLTCIQEAFSLLLWIIFWDSLNFVITDTRKHIVNTFFWIHSFS